MIEDKGTTGLTWRKSSYSGEDANKTDCVEIAFDGGAHVRDSKDPEGGIFSLSRAGWHGLLTVIQQLNVDK
jgi:hypothetical protein